MEFEIKRFFVKRLEPWRHSEGCTAFIRAPIPHQDLLMMKTKQISSILPILALGAAPAATVIDFEDYALGSNLAANGWSVTQDSSLVVAVTTANSGAYVGGRAIQTDPSGATFGGLLVSQLGITGLQVDMNWAFSGTPGSSTTPTVQLWGWDDIGSDGVFANTERNVGIAMDNNADPVPPRFEFFSAEGEVDGDLATAITQNNWYRLTLTWTDPDGSGNRDVTLHGYDLTNDLGGFGLQPGFVLSVPLIVF